eukprot:TRINITY_DN10500_c0_g1_i1.p1 TRINITY_DN10500_c0_g1~~TRINITY_DN10500_c0_g1_i1.p1  ORF type:complete len:306 (+),score=80.77 TRINITY_DN10500_c0_g1_i1:19-936(+)
MMDDVLENEHEMEIVEQRRIPKVPIKKSLGKPVIMLDNVRKEYSIEGREDKVRALDNINLAFNSEFYPIREGEFVMLRGPSGGGKTTMLNIIGTIDKVSDGTVEILGSKIDSTSKDEFLAQLRLEKIGFVFQTFNLIATMSAFENIELPMTILNKRTAKERRERAKELLGLVGLQDRGSHLPSELSGGEQQRVTIARALANDPVILLLDEPTGDLDTKNTIKIMDLLLDINLKLKITCMMVSHNPDLECYADRVLYLKNGVFEEQALNYIQTPLIYSEYILYLNSIEQEGKNSITSQDHFSDDEN